MGREALRGVRVEFLSRWRNWKKESFRVTTHDGSIYGDNGRIWLGN